MTYFSILLLFLRAPSVHNYILLCPSLFFPFPSSLILPFLQRLLCSATVLPDFFLYPSFLSAYQLSPLVARQHRLFGLQSFFFNSAILSEMFQHCSLFWNTFLY